jgi:hypothetical protein
MAVVSAVDELKAQGKQQQMLPGLAPIEQRLNEPRDLSK